MTVISPSFDRHFQTESPSLSGLLTVTYVPSLNATELLIAGMKGARKDLPNDYTINEPLIFSQSTYQPAAKEKDGVSNSLTRDCQAAGHETVKQLDTHVSNSLTQTEIETENQQNRNRKVTVAVFNSTLKHVGANGLPKPSEQNWQDLVASNPIYFALDLCGLRPGMNTYTENSKTFSSVIMRLGRQKAFDILWEIKSRKKIGELKTARNLPAIITKALVNATQ